MKLELVGAASGALVMVAALTSVYVHFDRELQRALRDLQCLS